MRRFALGLASVGGAGYFPWASGTFASFLVLPAVWFLWPHPGADAATTAAVCVLGVWSADVAEAVLGEKDSHKIVIDEVAGMLVAAAALPPSWFHLAGAFVLFRIFDVWKPFPARRSQRLPGGWGVMIDDLVAGIYANLVLQVIRLMTP